MSGTTLAACATAVPNLSTTLLYNPSTKLFSGARFQSVTGIMTPPGIDLAVSTLSVGLLSDRITHYGPGALRSIGPVTVMTYTYPGITGGTNTAGVVLDTSANYYWDFAQS